MSIEHSPKQGKGLDPDPHVPEHPQNKQQPTPQRVNAAGTHHYTKVRVTKQRDEACPDLRIRCLAHCLNIRT